MTNDRKNTEANTDESAQGNARAPFAGKRLAREWALQTLYASRQAGESVDEVWPRLIELPGEEIDVPGGGYRRFARKLTRQVGMLTEDIDQAIKPSLNNWRLERLTVIDLMIIRLALVEMSLHPSTPQKVILNEYIEIAKDFGSPESPKFINGVLDDLARRIREQPEGEPLVSFPKDEEQAESTP